MAWAALFNADRTLAVQVVSPAVGAYFALLTGILLAFINHRVERVRDSHSALNEAMALLNHNSVILGLSRHRLASLEDEYREIVAKKQRSISPVTFPSFDYTPQLGGRFLKDEMNNTYHAALAELRKIDLNLHTLGEAHRQLSELALNGSLDLEEYHHNLLSLIPQLRRGLLGCRVAESAVIDFIAMCRVMKETESSRYFLFFPNLTFSDQQRERFSDAREWVVNSLERNMEASRQRMREAGIEPPNNFDPPR